MPYVNFHEECWDFSSFGPIGDETWLHLVGDHLYLSHTDVCCARQLIDAAVAQSCAISAVQHTRENRHNR